MVAEVIQVTGFAGADSSPFSLTSKVETKITQSKPEIRLTILTQVVQKDGALGQGVPPEAGIHHQVS
jgi:hypothetical protein